MGDTLPTATPPWLSEELPEGNWHVDLDFLDRTHDALEEVGRILNMEDFFTSLMPASEGCECNSMDGGDESGEEEMEETYCPKRSASRPDFNRTFLLLDRILPRLKFAAEKLDAVITKVIKRWAKLNSYQLRLDMRLTEMEQPTAGPKNQELDGNVECKPNWTSIPLMHCLILCLTLCPGSPAQTSFRLERMPVEIISNIALLASEQDRRIPFTLSRVNTALRRLVLSMPLVWANVDAADPVTNTKIRIQRSRNVPLTVNLWIPLHLTNEEGKERVLKFIEILEPERHRLRTLIIKPFLREWMEQAFKSLKKHGYDSLETLHLGFAEGDPMSGPLKTSILPAKLRELNLTKTPIYSSGSFCTQVVRLSLTDVTLPLFGFRQAFGTMCALERVRLNDIRVDRVERTSLDPILLPQLRYLVIKNSNAGLITSILDTPGLFSFQLDNPIGNPPSDPDNTATSILPAIAKRNSQLRRLHVVGYSMEEDAWAESLYNLSELEYLRIKGCHIEANHLAALRGLDAGKGSTEDGHRLQRSACQLLEELVLENELSIDSGTVKDIVELRSMDPDTGVGIKWVTLRGCDADLIKDEDVEAMAQLTKGFACDLIDGKEAWAENSDGSSTGSGDWDSSDGELESSSGEDDD
ncbi:hypothetical protein FS837_001324 [Tulasnella sp. UAMH 9824]|nr:hypothetical protein FS837_001324 [Tulasnella sp. UAMH 9824]